MGSILNLPIYSENQIFSGSPETHELLAYTFSDISSNNNFIPNFISYKKHAEMTNASDFSTIP